MVALWSSLSFGELKLISCLEEYVESLISGIFVYVRRYEKTNELAEEIELQC